MKCKAGLRIGAWSDNANFCQFTGRSFRESRDVSLACYRAHIARAYFGTKYNMLHKCVAQNELEINANSMKKTNEVNH